MSEVIYIPREYAYNVAGEPPIKHPRAFLPWEIVSETFHTRGVTVIWRAVLEFPAPDTIPAPPHADPEEGGLD